METISIIIFIAIVIVAIAIVKILLPWIVRLERKKRKERTNIIFQGLESIDAQSFYERYYRDKGIEIQIIKGIREVLEKVLDADMSRIQPGDDFTKNLKYYFDSDSMADVEIVVGIEKTFEIKIADEEAQRTKTIDDLIMLVKEKIKLKTA